MDIITWEDKVGHTDASDLGFEPGLWPKVLVAKDAKDERQAFALVAPERDREGDLFRMKYESKSGLVLFVYND